MSKDPIPAPEIEAALARVGVADRADERAGTHSQGMKQRLALAAALLHGRDLLIPDEPTNGLDPRGVPHTPNRRT